jgi:cytochrome c oxidase subunit 2
MSAAMKAAMSRRTMLAWMAAAAVVPMVRHGDAATPRVIQMRARRFVFIPDRVKLKPGETVVLSITAEDVMMGFSAPDFNVRADLPPGQAVKVTLTAGKPGSYGFLCDIFCGSGHENMNGLIEVA